MRLHGYAFAGVLCASALGCDPTFAVTGVVVDKESGAGLEGAEIQVNCGTKIALTEKSDGAGKFRVEAKTGIVPKDPCTMTVNKPGFAAGSPTVEPCGSQWTSCWRDVGRVELAPKP